MWNQQQYSSSVWWKANITSVAWHLRGNKDFHSRVRRQRSFFKIFFCQAGGTSKFDERFVSDALLPAPSSVSLQCTWCSSLAGWSSVTLKSRPTGFITTLIIVALVRSQGTLSHLWKGRAQQGFSWIKTRAGQRPADGTSHYLAWFPLSPCYKVLSCSQTWDYLTILHAKWTEDLSYYCTCWN